MPYDVMPHDINRTGRQERKVCCRRVSDPCAHYFNFSVSHKIKVGLNHFRVCNLLKIYNYLVQPFGTFMRFLSNSSRIAVAKIELVLLVLGKCACSCSILIGHPQWDSHTEHMKWALLFRSFYLSKSWNVGQTYLHLTGLESHPNTSWDNHSGWQCCNVAKETGLRIGKPGF